MPGPIKVNENQPIDAGEPTAADIERARRNYAAMSPQRKAYLRELDNRVRGLQSVREVREAQALLDRNYGRLREDYNPDEPRDDHGRWEGGGGSGSEITSAEARGDSRPVSRSEFQALAASGHEQLARMRASGSPPVGLDRNYDTVKANAFAEVQKPWGGVTIDTHTGVPLTPSTGGKYALSVSGLAGGTISVPEDAARETFNAAMDQARTQFAAELAADDHYLGVFHDDDLKRIDIDVVVNATSIPMVEQIGAAAHSIGGAYDYATGDGIWVPHVAG